MSPLHEKFADVPGGIQVLVRAELEKFGLEISVLSQTGFAFVVAQRESGALIKIENLCDLSETQIADGMKQSSNRHLIKPLNGSSKHDRNNVHHARLDEMFRSSRSSR